MGGCCSASGTADGAMPPAPSSKAPATKLSSDPPRPVSPTPADKTPAPSNALVQPSPKGAAQTSSAADKAQSPTLPYANPSVAGGPPAAQADRTSHTPPALPPLPASRATQEATKPEVKAIPHHADFDDDDGAFSEPEAKPKAESRAKRVPSPPPAPAPASALVAAPVAVTAPTPSSADVTPERAAPPPPPPADDGPTRGPSTARVEEVPPTPQEDDAARPPPANDARVLQRVPPPPPPPPSAAAPAETAVTPVAAAAPQAPEMTPPPPAEEEAEEADVPANPLADILRRQQEDKQRYPTALSTDAAEDAPLEISMGDDASPLVPASAATAVPASSGSYTIVHETVHTPPPPPPPGLVAAVQQPHTHDAPEDADAAATPIASTTIVAPAEVSGPTSGIVYKLLRHPEWVVFKASGELHGTPADEVDGYINLATAEQAPKAAEDLFADDTRLSLLACSIEELSRVEPDSHTDTRLLAGPPLRWESSHGTELSPRLYRPLRLATDVLWRQRCADAAEVAEKISAAVVLSDSDSTASSADALVEEEEEAAAAEVQGRDEAGEKPITFTDTSEIERELEAADDEDAEDEEQQEANGAAEGADAPASMDKDRVYTLSDDNKGSKAAADDEDKPQVVVASVVPAVALVSPAPAAEEPAAIPAQHASSAMHAVEETVWTGADAPRRVPPPVPSRDDVKEPEKNGRATPPPSRPAPSSTILSPPPA